MRLRVMLATLAAASLVVRAFESEDAQSEGESPFVDDITGVDFASWLNQHPVAVVMFYSPTNRRSVPYFNMFAATLKPTEKDVPFAKMDCTTEATNQTCLPYIDDGLPTITIFSDGRPWKNPAALPIPKRAAAGKDPDVESEAVDIMARLKKATTELVEHQRGKELRDKYAVDDITGINLVAWLDNHPIALVMFYSPKSPVYHMVLPYFGGHVGGLKNSNPYFTPAKIDCTADASKDDCVPYFDSGSPSFTVFKDGQPWSGEQTPFAYRIREEELHIESIWNSGAEETDDIFQGDDPVYNSPGMARLRKALAVLTFLLKEQKQDESRSDDHSSQSENSVVYLTGGDFSARIKSHPVAFVMFYSPRSSYYGRLQRFFDLITHVLQNGYPDTLFAKIDCSLAESEEICDEHVGSAIPSFVVFRDGYIYQNTRESLPRATRFIESDIVETALHGLEDADFIGSLKDSMGTLADVQLEIAYLEQLESTRDDL